MDGAALPTKLATTYGGASVNWNEKLERHGVRLSERLWENSKRLV